MEKNTAKNPNGYEVVEGMIACEGLGHLEEESKFTNSY